jgi:hypothetical protein
MRSLRVLAAVLAAFSSLAASTAVASAEDEGHSRSLTCSGGSLASGSPSLINPGTYSSIKVTGMCVIPGGTVHVRGDISVEPGAVLITNHPGTPPGQTGPPEDDATTTVGGDVLVGKGATLIMGCAPSSGCTVTTKNRIEGSVKADRPLGLLIRGTTIEENYSIHGGGGQDYDCSPMGFFANLHAPVFTALEDARVGGNVSIRGYQSCWLGIARTKVGGNLSVVDNALGDDDAIEILSNTIDGSLSCRGNKVVDVSQTPATFTLHNPWDNVELSQTGTFPRGPQPNKVEGKRHGQCVLASPTTLGGPSGPGPF